MKEEALPHFLTPSTQFGSKDSTPRMHSASNPPHTYAPGQALPDGSRARSSGALLFGPALGPPRGEQNYSHTSLQSWGAWSQGTPRREAELRRQVGGAGLGGPGYCPARPDSPSLTQPVFSGC